MTRVKVLCVDDSDDIASIVSQVVNDQPDLECVATLNSADQLVERIGELKADVVILDLSMPGRPPLDAMRDATRLYPNTRVVVVSGYDDDRSVEQAAEHGAWGFASKAGDLQVILDAIRSVYRGERYFKVTRN